MNTPNLTDALFATMRALVEDRDARAAEEDDLRQRLATSYREINILKNEREELKAEIAKRQNERDEDRREQMRDARERYRKEREEDEHARCLRDVTKPKDVR